MKELKGAGDIAGIEVDGKRKLFSATHDEIEAGATTDVYWLRTYDILGKLGLMDARVVADVFARDPGVFCGVEETRRFLEGRNVGVLAVPEGERFEAKQTVMQISGRYGGFGMYETVVLGILASSSGWATAAAEIKEAAGDSAVICFGSRHIHPAVAPVMERASLVGGMDGCSCILGALLKGTKPVGTVPHASILIAGDTVRVAEVFDEIYADDVPRIILVDTFKDEGEEALRVAHALKKRLAGVRLDTPSERGGVTPDLVREVRRRLDIEGFDHVKIVVSGGLTPEKIRIHKRMGADMFGVGSWVACASPIEMTMDIKEINGRPVAKRGRLPGPDTNEKLVRII
ncbi:MAG: nicotinate phosphoribosyltransferase [bacterium]